MQTFEAAAVISLVDHLTGPMRSMAASVAGHESELARRAQRMSNIGQHMTYQMTVPILAGMHDMMERAREFSRVENATMGVLENRARQIKGLTTSTHEYAEAVERALNASADLAYQGGSGLPRGMVNTKDYMESQMALLKAGFNADSTDPAAAAAPIRALADTAAQLSVANSIPGHLVSLSQATEGVANMMNGLGVQLKDEQNKPLPLEVLRQRTARVADMITTMTQNGMMSFDDVMQSFKYSGPLAKMSGTSPEFLAALIATQSENGIRGSEAGVAQRSLFMSLMAPKSTAGRALASIGVDIHKYQTEGAGFNEDNFAKQIHDAGYRMSAGIVKGAFDKLRAGDIDTQQFSNELSTHLQKTGSSKNPIAPATAQKLIDQLINQQAGATDIIGLITDIREHGGLTAGLWKQIGEGRQGVRLLSLLNKAAPGERDIFRTEMRRMFGDSWDTYTNDPKHKRSDLHLVTGGTTDRTAEEHSHGLDAALTKIGNSWDELAHKLENERVFDMVVDDVAKVTTGLASLNPEVLRFGFEGAAAVAALGPLIWALGSVGTAAAAAGRVMGLLSGSVAAAEKAVASSGPVMRAAAQAAEGGLGTIERAASRVALTRIQAEAAANAAAEAAREAASRTAAVVAQGLREQAAYLSSQAAEEASSFASKTGEAARAMETAWQGAMRGVAEAGADAARAAQNLAAFKAAASDSAELAERAMGNLVRTIEGHIGDVARGGFNAFEEAFVRVEEAALRSGRVLETLKPLASDTQAALDAARGSAQMAEKLGQGLAEAEARAATAQSAVASANDAAAAAAGRLEGAVKAAADAMETSRARAATAKAAEETAETGAKALGKGGSEAAQAAAQAARKTAEDTARAAEEASKHAAHAEMAQKTVQTVAEDAAKRAAFWGMIGRGVAIASGIGDVLQSAWAVHETSIARHDRENDVAGIIAGQYRDELAMIQHASPEEFSRARMPGLSYNPYRAQGYYTDAMAEQDRRKRDEFFKDHEGTVAHNAQINAGITAQSQGPVQVHGEVSGQAEVATTIGVTVNASPMLTALVDKMEHALTTMVTLEGKMGDQMGGTNGVKSPPSRGQTGFGNGRWLIMDSGVMAWRLVGAGDVGPGTVCGLD